MGKSGGRKGHKSVTHTGLQREVTERISRLLPLAVQQHQQGHFPGAQKRYQQILELNPRHADALQYYGILCQQMGDSERAEKLIRQAIGINPSVAPYFDNLGSVLEAGERYAEALAAYEKAEQLEPGDPDRYYNRGIALERLSRFEEALSAYQAALAAHPADAECLFGIGNVHKAQGRLGEAQNAYRQALKCAPNHVGAEINLGNVLQTSGQLHEAEDCFRHVLIQQPDNAQLQHNLASVLSQQDRLTAALVHFQKALKLDSEFSEVMLGAGRAHEALGELEDALGQYRNLLHDSVYGADAQAGVLRIARSYSPVGYDAQFCAVLLNAIDAGQVTAASMAWVLARQWRLQAKLSPEALDYDGQVLQFAISAGLDPLLLTLLRSAINVDPVLEKWLTRLRRIFLFSHEDLEDLVPLQMALALQCFHNESVLALDAAEQTRLDLIENRLQERFAQNATHEIQPPQWRELLQLACYQPLYRLQFADTLAAIEDAHWPAHWRELICVSLQQPRMEAQIASHLPTLGEVTDQISLKVRAQYEESPYPRWLSLPRQQRGGLTALLTQVLNGDAAALITNSDQFRILAAGCGTGQEALALATLEPQAKVVGLDLSTASLAFAERMARSLGLENIRFMQGDLLQLPAVYKKRTESFNFIATSGVLHHMQDPLAGWQALVQVLAPGGLMKVALYSTRARQTIALAHGRIRALGLAASEQGVRTFRQRLLQGQEVALENLLESEDFYALSTCRDLLFHVLEHTFEIHQISQMLDQLDLEFLGFELAHPSIRREFLAQYPDRYTDLGAWAAFEDAHPQTFEAMYVLWCRKPLSGD